MSELSDKLGHPNIVSLAEAKELGWSFWRWMRESTPNRRRATAAHKAVRRALASGELVKPDTCQRCGGTFPSRLIHGHHADYDRPLDVEWLCRGCHYKHHGESRRKVA